MVGVRLVFMQAIQRRRERENWQINECLKVLIAASETLGGSFTGELNVAPPSSARTVAAINMRICRVVARTEASACAPVAWGREPAMRGLCVIVAYWMNCCEEVPFQTGLTLMMCCCHLRRGRRLAGMAMRQTVMPLARIFRRSPASNGCQAGNVSPRWMRR